MIYNLSVSASGVPSGAEKILLIQGTAYADHLVIAVPDVSSGTDISGAYLHLEFLDPLGTAARSPMLTKADGKITCDIEGWVTANPGRGAFEVVATEEVDSKDHIWRSKPIAYYVAASANAVGEMDPPDPDWLLQVDQAIADAAAAKTASETAVAIANGADGKANTAIATSETAAGDAAAAKAQAEALPAYVLTNIGAHNAADNAHTDIRGEVATVRAIAEGATQGFAYTNYEALVSTLNAASSTFLTLGRNLLVKTLGVPDVWVSAVKETSVPYTYVSDEDFEAALLNTVTPVQCGYYELSMLEGRKVDLSDYYTKEEIDAFLPHTKTQAEYDALLTAGTWEPGRTYFVIEAAE